MKTIFDYLKNNNDELKETNFTAVDALILARISYLPLQHLLKKDEKKPLIELFEILTCFRDEFFVVEDDRKFVNFLLKNKRFSKCMLSYCVNEVDTTDCMQFGAVLIDIGFAKYVSFKGTDRSLVGIKEDLDMSYKEIPAQKKALKYLENILTKTEGKFIVGGHSKGGNMAIYSCIYLDPEDKKRIVKIYNFDGPGFLQTVLDEEGYIEILDKIETILPTSAFIGLLLERKEKVKIVNSDSFFVMQHDIYSWEVKGKDFAYLKSLTNISKTMNKSIDIWLKEISKEERMEFIDKLYTLAKEKKIKNIKELDLRLVSKLFNTVIKNIKFR